MPAQLLSLDNSASIMLDKPILLVGRHPECDIQIDSRKISRRHCCIAQVADYLVIRDLGSTNGVRINGNRVNEGKLVGGDEVTIGNNRYQVTWQEHEPEQPVRGPAFDKANGPVAGAAKAADLNAAPAKAASLPDHMLDECDEPVALDDEDDDEKFPARRTPPSPLPAPSVDAKLPDEARPVRENFDLAPHSDVFPPNDAGRAT